MIAVLDTSMVRQSGPVKGFVHPFSEVSLRPYVFDVTVDMHVSAENTTFVFGLLSRRYYYRADDNSADENFEKEFQLDSIINLK